MSTNTKSYAFIGDIHSQSHLLAAALQYCKSKGVTPILLGDIFDSRCEFSNSMETYHLVREVQAQGGVVLSSNHQDKLRRYLLGNPVELYTYSGLTRTIEELFKSENPLDPSEIAQWLGSLPYGFVFTSARGVTYKVSHAYFPSWLEGEGEIHFEHINRKCRLLMLYGKRDEDNNRIAWWESKNTYPWVRVAGHYHVMSRSSSSLVLDACCGDPEGSLAVFLSDSEQTILFSGSPKGKIETTVIDL